MTTPFVPLNFNYTIGYISQRFGIDQKYVKAGLDIIQSSQYQLHNFECG